MHASRRDWLHLYHNTKKIGFLVLSKERVKSRAWQSML